MFITSLSDLNYMFIIRNIRIKSNFSLRCVKFRNKHSSKHVFQYKFRLKILKSIFFVVATDVHDSIVDFPTQVGQPVSAVRRHGNDKQARRHLPERGYRILTRTIPTQLHTFSSPF